MQHKRISRLLLAAGAIALLGGAAILFLYLPLSGREMAAQYPEFAHLYWPALIYLWVIGLLYGAALLEYMRISVRIGGNRSFCAENVRGLRAIAICFAAAAALWLVAIPLIGLHLWWDLLLFAMASAAVALLAYSLSALLRHAVALQEENDLTV